MNDLSWELRIDVCRDVGQTTESLAYLFIYWLVGWLPNVRNSFVVVAV